LYLLGDRIQPMLRARLSTHLLFNLVLAVWVWYDATTRRARKPLFASAITLMWGPLGLAFWAAERPLASDETRLGGSAWVMARTFVLALTALVPAAFVLIVADIRDRAAVPGSFGASIGVLPASIVVTAAGWALVTGGALVLGLASRGSAVVEHGTSAVTPARPPIEAALAVGGTAALALALMQR
jgi:hypothetical protein